MSPNHLRAALRQNLPKTGTIQKQSTKPLFSVSLSAETETAKKEVKSLQQRDVVSRISNRNRTQHLITALDNCNSIPTLKKIHALLLTLGLFQDDPFLSRLLSNLSLSEYADIDYAYRVLIRLKYPRVFYWNTLIRGYSKIIPERCFSVYVEMLRNGGKPDHLTYPFMAKAVGSCGKLGSLVHCCVLKNGFECDRFVRNALVHMYAACGDIVKARIVFDGIEVKNSVSWNSMLDGYAKCGDVGSARGVFEAMPERDVVSWSSMIDGYVKSGEYKEALEVFEKMQVDGPKGNEVTMVSVLSACAHLGVLEKGRMMHRYMSDNRVRLTLTLQTSLLDMYAKCGAVEEALCVFRGVSEMSTDVFVWNAMIGGLATHGLVKESHELFEEMQSSGVAPDEITYLCLLSSCAHGGLVKEAWNIFALIGRRGMTPNIEHYACMVDVLARAGQVREAYQFINQMPMEPTKSMLGALLNGCMNHGNLNLAEKVGQKLIEVDPDNDGRYIGLSNVYAAVRRWDEARSMREAMEKRGVKKAPGFSFVEISGNLHRFIAHDKTHPISEQIYKTLNLLVGQMKIDVNNDAQESVCRI